MVHIAQLSFAKGTSSDTAHEEIVGLLGVLRQNGQLLGTEWPIVDAGSQLRAIVMLPAADSLDPARNNEWIQRSLSQLSALGSGGPQVEILGQDPGGAQPCDCAEPSGYVLWTHYLTLESPLRCLDCFAPVPLYRVPPVDDSGYYGVLSWQADYQACDTLQMNCRTLEHLSLAQMSTLHSSLTRQGRELAEQLTQSTGRPVHYYLFHHYGREERPVCPSCGGNWGLAEPLHQRFDFRCDPCRLLSSTAND